jgi:hypothetical protein
MQINPNSLHAIADVTGDNLSPAARLFHATLMDLKINPLKPLAFQLSPTGLASQQQQVFNDTPRAY